MKESVLRFVSDLHSDQSGQGMVEYILVLALIALAATAGMKSVATSINEAFNTVGGKVTNALT
jgi:pilus assembly protein Flp/PilA